MSITQKLREFAWKTLGVAADASDDVIKDAISKALQSGKLTAKDFAVLSEPPPEDDPRKQLADIVTQAVIAGIKAATPVVAVAKVPDGSPDGTPAGGAPAVKTVDPPVAKAADASASDLDAAATEFDRAVDARAEKLVQK